MGLICLNPPQVEPVSLPELKQFCRLDPGDSSQDDQIITLAYEARSFCEAFTRRCFVKQQWRLLMDFFPGYIDLKLAGQKVSSPFVSGSNAVLVGIRYAVMNPFPPVQSIDAFTYLNANGMTTSMIVGPANVTAVANPSGNPIVITTDNPLALVEGSTVAFGGNVALLSLLNGQPSQVVQAITGNTITLYALGTGATIASGGTATGYNFVQDLLSNPARLSPIFGQMWPVARVVMNAVSIDFTTGYANPITVTMAANSKQISSPDYDFQLSDIGRPISVPRAGASGLGLNTIIQGLPSPPNGTALLRYGATTAVTDTTALLVNGAPGGATSANPTHWEKIRVGIKKYTLGSYLARIGGASMQDAEKEVKRVLYSMRDLRL